jgi:hypothetical protein
MRKLLLKKINSDLKKQSLNSLAKEIGIHQPTLFRIVRETSQGSIGNWEIIETYYNIKES